MTASHEIRVFSSLDASRSVWADMEASGDGYAFQSHAWLSAWYETIGRRADIELSIVLVELPKGRPLMLLPLGIERRRGAACLIWLGGALTDYQAPLLARDFAARLEAGRFAGLWAAIRDRLPPHDAILFDRQPESVGGQDNPFAALRGAPHASRAHRVNLEGDFDTFLANRRSSKTRSTDRRKRKKLAQLGAIDFVIAREAEDIERIVDVMLRQKSDNYRELGVVDLFTDKSHRDFVRLLAARHAGSGFVHLAALKLDERIVATHWGLVYKKWLYYLLPSYERGELTRYSPGNILLHHLFEWCFANEIIVCDFTVGDEPYKLQWRDAEMRLFEHRHARTLKGHASVLPAALKSRAKRVIKRSPALLNTLTALRSRKARLVRHLFANRGTHR